MNANRIAEIKARIEELETTMVQTFSQQRARNLELFQLSRELEELENPESYERNKAHWDGHQIRF